MAKILMVSTPLPFPMIGANDQDRAHGILQFLRLSFDVKLITEISRNEQKEQVNKISRELGIEILPLAPPPVAERLLFKRMISCAVRLARNPLMLDGAASVFDNPAIKAALLTQVARWKPNLVWFERSNTWPLYQIVKRFHVPIATRSHNFEPVDFLEDHGHKPWNYLWVFARLISELQTVRGSDVIFPITEREVSLYKKIGAKNIAALPLRSMPYFLRQTSRIKRVPKNSMLNVFFMGSTYKVLRNRKVLRFVLEHIIPRVQKVAPDSFRFHIFGKKLPKDCQPFLGRNVLYRGYVENLDEALSEMDIALAPYLQKGDARGMQQKIFEPLARGFPTVTSQNGLAGWPFENEKHVLIARNPDEYARQLARLKDPALREKIALGAKNRSRELFSQKALDAILLEKIGKFLN